MSRKHSMTLDEYETYLRRQVDAFFVHWREQHGKDPENWPMKQEGTSKSAPILEWEEQFDCWREMS